MRPPARWLADPWVWSLLALLLCGSIYQAEPAAAATWLCPGCYDARVDRDSESEPLVCSDCGASFEPEELSWDLGYLNHRTRDVEVAWIVTPESCEIYRPDGLQAFEFEVHEVWVPWKAVSWYIPRMRLLKLKNGAELQTDYPKSETLCPAPPEFAFQMTDSLFLPDREPRAQTVATQADMAELFIVAASPAARDSARQRFIEEVETGNHPRLPRTPVKVRNLRTPVLPGGTATGEVVLEVTASERGQVLRIEVVESSGDGELEQAAIQAAQGTAYQTAGEMGVPVPGTVVMHYYFEGAQARVEHEPAVPGVWKDIPR